MRLEKINKLKNGNLLFVYINEISDNGDTGKCGLGNCDIFVMEPGSIRESSHELLNRENVINQVVVNAYYGEIDMDRTYYDRKMSAYEWLNIEKSDINL